MTNNRFVDIINSMRYFGLIQGPSTYFSRVLFRLHKPSYLNEKRIFLRAWHEHLHIRPGTGDWTVLYKIYVDKEYDTGFSPIHDMQLRAFYQNISSDKIPLIIDCGANIGLSSIWFATMFPRATVVAVEPEPANATLLRKNVASFPNIIAIEAGVSDRTGRLSMTAASSETYAWETKQEADGAIKGITMDSLFEMIENCEPFIVKIDIEGSERILFSHNSEWTKKIPLIIIEIHDWLFPWKGNGNAVFSHISREKRDYIQHGENMFLFSHRLLNRS